MSISPQLSGDLFCSAACAPFLPNEYSIPACYFRLSLSLTPPVYPHGRAAATLIVYSLAHCICQLHRRPCSPLARFWSSHIVSVGRLLPQTRLFNHESSLIFGLATYPSLLSLSLSKHYICSATDNPHTPFINHHLIPLAPFATSTTTSSSSPWA